jgi:Flp pilus assembly protein TadG
MFNRKGTAAVELALVLPLFPVIFSLIMEGGSLFQKQIALINAAREGARQYAQTENYDSVGQSLTAQGITDYTVQITSTLIIPAMPDYPHYQDKVTITAPFNRLFLIPLDLTLRASCTMRRLK